MGTSSDFFLKFNIDLQVSSLCEITQGLNNRKVLFRVKRPTYDFS